MSSNDPWEGDNNNFNANFADFDAFNSNADKSNGGGFGAGSNGVNDLGSSGMGNFANFDAFQHQPLLPANNGNSTGGVLESHSANNLPPPVSSTGGGNEDKYAALKDLDNIFKQGLSKCVEKEMEFIDSYSIQFQSDMLILFIACRWGINRKWSGRKSWTIKFSVLSSKSFLF